MYEIHCHRYGHPAGTHVISSRAHLSVKPDTSMIVAYPIFSTTVFPVSYTHLTLPTILLV